jgi:hypothetical protein
MVKSNLSDCSIFFVGHFQVPVRTDPGKLIVNPHAHAAILSHDVVFLADMRKIQVAYVVVMIKTDKKFAVSYRDISWHPGLLLMSG